MTNRTDLRELDPRAVPDGIYAVEVVGGVVVGLTEMAAGGSLAVQDENSNVATDVTQIDFQGAAVTAAAGTGEVVVTIPLQILLLNAGAAVPAGTPAGIVIARKV